MWKTEKNIEGYWYSKHHPEYPMPIANTLTQEQAEEIYNLILEKEKTATIVWYMGWTDSRITGEMLGSDEYQIDEWLWPEDFAKHYVLEHKVKPTEKFLQYIGYNKMT